MSAEHTISSFLSTITSLTRPQHTLHLLSINRRFVISLLVYLLMHTRLVLRIAQPTAINAVLAIDAVFTVCIVLTARAARTIGAVLLALAVGARSAVLAACAVCVGVRGQLGVSSKEDARGRRRL